MPEASTALVILPTYNERQNIAPLIHEILTATSGTDILVVDDSSPDQTGRIVLRMSKAEPRIHLLSRPTRAGLAQAYIAGFRWGLDRGYSFLIEMDADFSHSPADLNRFTESLKQFDVVVGCRYIEGGGISGWPWIRSFISRGGNRYAQTILQLPYKDLTGGFNGWRREVLETICFEQIHSKGYAFQVELKFRAHRKKFKLLEIPIYFQNRLRGKSKMSSSIVWEAAFRVLQMRTVF